MATQSKQQSLAAVQALIAGIVKHLPTYEFIVDSKSETASEVLTVLRRRVKLAMNVVEARLALETAILASNEEEAATASYVSNVRQGVQAMFANSPTVLSDFGLSVRKPPTPLTAAAMMLAVERRAATRAARHTMGADQRAAIHGSLDGPVLVALDGTATVESPAGSDAVASKVTADVGAATPRS